MPEGLKKSLNVFLIKNILSEILAKENHKNLSNKQASTKPDDFVNDTDAVKVDMDERLVGTKVKVINKIPLTNSQSNFSNLLNNNCSNSISHESAVNDGYNALYQMEDECDDLLYEQKELPLEIMFTKNKSLLVDNIDKKEIKVKSQSSVNRIKNYSFMSKCLKQRPMVCYDYSCKTRNPSFKHVELLAPVKEKKWFEDYKMELQFLQENFSEVLPEILYDVVRKRVTDPVHYIVHYLIKHKVDKSTDG